MGAGFPDQKKFQPVEIEQLQNSLASYGVENTELIIKQDSVDLRSAILSEIDKHTVSVNEKDLTIRSLNQRLSRYELANVQLRLDMAILFPQIAHYSIGVQQYYNTRDSLVNYIAFVYQAKDDFPEEEKQK